MTETTLPCLSLLVFFPFSSVFRIHRIHMFLDLPDLDLGLLFKGIDPDPSVISINSKKNLDSYCFVTSFGLFIFEK
jgi:hypothetical protein